MSGFKIFFGNRGVVPPHVFGRPLVSVIGTKQGSASMSLGGFVLLEDGTGFVLLESGTGFVMLEESTRVVSATMTDEQGSAAMSARQGSAVIPTKQLIAT